MTIERIARWLEDNPVLAPWVLVGIALVLNAVVLLVARNLIARGLVYLAQRSKTRVDDILVKHMRPYRFTWLAPLLLTYYLATWVPQWTETAQTLVLIAILWLVVVTFLGLFTAINVIYESGSSYRGVSIQSYLDLGKLLTIVVGVILECGSDHGEIAHRALEWPWGDHGSAGPDLPRHTPLLRGQFTDPIARPGPRGRLDRDVSL